MAVVKAPNPKYTGIVAGVRFVDGQGETDDSLALNYFRRHGYEIIEPSKAQKKGKGSKDDGGDE